MTTPPQTTEQEQWVLVHKSPGGVVTWESIELSTQLVRVDWTKEGNPGVDVMAALADPARVLNVVAYPGVVEALEMALKIIDHAQPGSWANGVTGPGGSPDEGEVLTGRAIEQCRAKLSAVHPQPEAKRLDDTMDFGEKG